METLSIIGNIGKDATIQESNGSKFVSFSVACSKSYKKADGSKVETTNWYSVTTQSEKLAPYLKKGTKVYISGEPKYSIYKKQNGGDWQVNVSLNASKIELLSSPSDKDSNSASKDNTQATITEETPWTPPVIEGPNGSENLPF